MRTTIMPRRKRIERVQHHRVFRDAEGKEVTLQRGDVIGVDRGLYEHYGIYCGNNEVIHYTEAPRNRGKERFVIQKTNMDRFLKKQKSLFVLDCVDPLNPTKSGPITPSPRQLPSLDWFFQNNIAEDFHLYSPEETVARAESQIGKGKYNLLVNNCEHFAVWCKTGLHRSYQVNEVLKHFKKFFYGT